MTSINYVTTANTVPFIKVLDLYVSVGWTNYTKNPENLKKALDNSSHIIYALQEDHLIGLIRSISDDVSIHFIQDILVLENFQRQGVGRQLMNLALERYKHIPKHVLLTDDEPEQHAFYKACGFEKLPAQLTNSFSLTNGYIKL